MGVVKEIDVIVPADELVLERWKKHSESDESDQQRSKPVDPSRGRRQDRRAVMWATVALLPLRAHLERRQFLLAAHRSAAGDCGGTAAALDQRQRRGGQRAATGCALLRMTCVSAMASIAGVCEGS
ncbi:MAG: hypothetical protein AUI36_10990 [Cyanobacteria bacterium 13_1_40CM_2_61_4]|nr:MAG: hypothetical protein AUI36_10990 [Cyanobacteria bacterium 13_1_40CM_2_61_4]